MKKDATDKFLALVDKYGHTAVKTFDLTVQFFEKTNFRTETDIMIVDMLILLGPTGFSAMNAELVLDASTGNVMVDVHGFFGPKSSVTDVLLLGFSDPANQVKSKGH